MEMLIGNYSYYFLVPMNGIEPARPCGQWILNPSILGGERPIYTEIYRNYAVAVCVIVVN